MDCIIRTLWLSTIPHAASCSGHVKAVHVHVIILAINQKLYESTIYYNSNKLTPIKDILSVTYDAGSQSLLNVKIPFQILREFYFLFIIIYLQIQHFRYILSICIPLSQSET